MDKKLMLRTQIGLMQQSIWKVEQAREIFEQATCKNPALNRQFGDLIEDLESAMDNIHETLVEMNNATEKTSDSQ